MASETLILGLTLAGYCDLSHSTRQHQNEHKRFALYRGSSFSTPVSVLWFDAVRGSARICDAACDWILRIANNIRATAISRHGSAVESHH